MTDNAEKLTRLTTSGSTEELLPAVYDELRRMATVRMRGERLEHTLQGTALVHEVYMRLVESAGSQVWENRGHFFAAAARAMRRILVDSARAKMTEKRGGNHRRVELQDFVDSNTDTRDMLLDLDEGLSRLAEEDAESAELVQLRLFAGLSVTEAGQALGMARSTAYENWQFARSWIAAHMESPDE